MRINEVIARINELAHKAKAEGLTPDEQAEQKKLREERNAMTKGTNVVTAGGIYGRIQEVGDTYFIISVDGSVKLKVDKNSVYPSAADASTDANNSTVSKG